jgi:hypothetical protein
MSGTSNIKDEIKVKQRKAKQREACKGCKHNLGAIRFNFAPCLRCSREVRSDYYER